MIDTKEKLDQWFEKFKGDISKGARYIYRGNSSSAYMMYTSAQREWLTSEMNQWSGVSYLEFIKKGIDVALRTKLLSKVFNSYGYARNRRDFPVLALLQHYGAPTPLLDWSYNHHVALYFATEKQLVSSSDF